MNTKHTPGPWTVGVDAAHPMNRRINSDCRQIAKVYASAMNVDDATANARLIAAASDLLAALISAHELNVWAMECFGFDADLSKSVAAITKATGAAA